MAASQRGRASLAAFVVASASVCSSNAGGPSREPLLPAATTTARTGSVAVLRTPGAEMVLVAAGTFEMGSQPMELQLVMDACKREPRGIQCDARFFANELATHRVTLSSYWLDRTEVTVGEYTRCVVAGPCDPPPYEQGASRFDRPELPVVMVSWNDARTYCSFVGKRLPTEAEWERAARGVAARRFPWGHHWATRRANHGKLAIDAHDGADGHLELAAVGTYPDGRTPDGFEDLAGNVSEWVEDVYEDAYEAMPVTNPRGPSSGGFRVIRGGSYLDAMPWLRGASRGYRGPGARETTIGFRCARDAR